MDVVEIDELRVRCVLGVTPDERRARQEVLISLRVGVDARPAMDRDELGAVWDYRAATKAVLAMAEASSFQTVERLAGEVATVCLARGAAGPAAGPAGWESAAATAFHAAHRSRLDRLTTLAASYQAVGDTLAGTADQAGQVHAALLTTTQAAGDEVRLLGDAMSPGGAAHAVVTAWLAGGQALLDAWATHTDQVAATLTALHSATLDPANPEPLLTSRTGGGIGELTDHVNVRATITGQTTTSTTRPTPS